MVQDAAINTNHAQLIFTTHDTGLLDLTLLRRDQIWFAEKDEKTMQTDIYALTEFSCLLYTSKMCIRDRNWS